MEIHFIYRIRFCFIELMLRMWSMPPEKDRPWWEAAAGICRNVFLGNGTNYLLIVFFDRSIPQQYLDWMGRREAGRVCWSWNMGRNCPLWKDPILGSCSFIAPCGQQPAAASTGSPWQLLDTRRRIVTTFIFKWSTQQPVQEARIQDTMILKNMVWVLELTMVTFKVSFITPQVWMIF